ncbi:AraC family transcriptional regulator [Roseomonas sp. M0104]|uniref:AraC family transcriptional regulator n=1 Tax=Teichococcus coralli TaxID=2545983 RepID=A0A845BBB9_9PROT|nr:AraC family transcriptional regulator [Pseudoroseomonas coralli]MXP62667.1 AraC family transcriptional regulator [Pseudoroseomonas coralli]
MGADTLSEVLRAVRLSGAVFFRIDVCAPWVAETPPAAMCAPFIMPQAQHLMEFHIIGHGPCFGGLADAEPVALEVGDVLAFPQGDPHVLSSAPGLRQRPDLGLYRSAGSARLPFAVALGEGGPPTGRLICGFLGCDARPFNPLLQALPRMLHFRSRAEPDAGWFRPLVEAVVAESAAPRIGGECILARLSELLFIELVRRHLRATPEGETGWLAGLRDIHVGRSLNLLHARPAVAWTLESLAREAGLSRSSLAERFTRLVGQPPMQYLARWRMQLAAGLLADDDRPVAQVALAVGYESEAAFSRAFHRLTGLPPSAWRRARAQEPAGGIS